MDQKADIRNLLLEYVDQPIIFNHFISDWPAMSWNPRFLAATLDKQVIKFRLGPKSQGNSDVLWESECCYEEATLSEFCDWLSGSSNENVLSQYDPDTHWCYGDYKYMAQLFQDNQEMLKSVFWDNFGFSGRDGRQSTIWIGSEGAFTPCHSDSYGCNLVAQIYGVKRWFLFPPKESYSLYPTRIPYEESSVFSQVNIKNPDLRKYKRFKDSSPYIVTLQPGQVLFVPMHWWHYVECLDTSISINSWIELESDKSERVKEALTRVVTCSLMSCDQTDNFDWLNPTEEFTSHTQNMEYLSQAVSVVLSNEKEMAAKQVVDLCTPSNESGLTVGDHKESKEKFIKRKAQEEANLVTRDKPAAEDDRMVMGTGEAAQKRVKADNLFCDNQTEENRSCHTTAAAQSVPDCAPVMKMSQLNPNHNPTKMVSTPESMPSNEPRSENITKEHMLEKYKNFITPVQKYSFEEYLQIIGQIPVEDDDSTPELNISTEQLVNAITHPDVMAKVAEILVKELK